MYNFQKQKSFCTKAVFTDNHSIESEEVHIHIFEIRFTTSLVKQSSCLLDTALEEVEKEVEDASDVSCLK